MNYTEKMNGLIGFIHKSIDDNSRLEYFKNELLKILDEKEKYEGHLSKSIDSYFKSLDKTLYDEFGIEKGRVGTIGEIRTWKDGKKYKKMPNGKWVRVYQSQDRGAEISIARLKGRIKRAQSVEELYDIVSKNIHRFEDSNGQILPIVEELKKELNTSKERINSGKPSTADQIKQFQDSKKAEEKKKKAAVKVSKPKTKKTAPKVEAPKEENPEEKTPEVTENITVEPITIRDLPDRIGRSKWKSDFKMMLDYINNCENADPKVLRLFKNSGKINFKYPFELKQRPENADYAGAFIVSIGTTSGIPAEISLELDHESFTKQKRDYLIPVMLHELGHFFDFNGHDKKIRYGVSELDNSFLDSIENIKVTDEIYEEATKEGKKDFAIFKELNRRIEASNNKLKDINNNYKNNQYASYDEYFSVFNAQLAKHNMDKQRWDDMHAKCMSNSFYGDIIDALTNGRFKSDGLYGHGKEYWNEIGYKALETNEREYSRNKAKEIFANYIALSVFAPEKIERLKKYFPELCKNVDSLIERINNYYVGGN